MKLSFSNIAWSAARDEEMYAFLYEYGFGGIEIAPTRIFPDKPYERISEARLYAAMLCERYNLKVSSMQSIWYGRGENIFNSNIDRTVLADYTRTAVDFAAAIGCENLVFGCPKNRHMPDGADVQAAYDFFNEIAEYAHKKGTVIAIEPNPTIYGTNFINRTSEAFDFARRINGLAVNIDLGTIIENNESIHIVADNIALVNHVHISEPNLVKIERRGLHLELAEMLTACNYGRFISVEMKNPGNLEIVKEAAIYAQGVFCAE